MKTISNLFNERGLRNLAWASLISQIIIVFTGGLVRLTASGLGCPTWPNCTPTHLTTVPEQGIHGIIEFTNRMLTFVLLLIAVGMFVAALRSRNGRKLLLPAIALNLGIVLQAVIGGISVLTHLNPWVVGLHFVVSVLMIMVAALQLWRTYNPRHSTSPGIERALSSWLLVSGVLAELVGVVLTGSGPHAGDFKAPRNGLDSALWQVLHSIPAYVTLFISLFLLILVRRRDVNGYSSRIVYWTVFCLVGQVALGILQANTGLPSYLVAIHMLLAATLCSLVFLQFLVSRK